MIKASTHIRFDWAIKRLLRQEANFVILEGFLSELLRRDVSIIEILESEGNKESEEDKFNRVDILAKIDQGELVIIEVQNEREHDYFHRMNYAQGKLVSQYFGESSKYKEVKRIISVNIVYFELGQGNDYVYEGHTEFKGIHTHDILELSHLQKKAFPELEYVHEIFARYYIIKVNHFNDVAKDSLDEWIYFLKNSEIKDEFTARGIAEAKKVLRKDEMSEPERIQYEHFVKEQRIRESEIESAILEVEEKLMRVIEDERAEKEKANAEKELAMKKEAEALSLVENMVKRLAAKGFSVAEIAEDTGLSEDEVKNMLAR